MIIYYYIFVFLQNENSLSISMVTESSKTSVLELTSNSLTWNNLFSVGTGLNHCWNPLRKMALNQLLLFQFMLFLKIILFLAVDALFLKYTTYKNFAKFHFYSKTKLLNRGTYIVHSKNVIFCKSLRSSAI